MILGFKKCFEPKIVDGSKIHTIREDVKDRWDVGRTIQFATGVRSKNYRCFKEGIVVSIQYIFMTYSRSQFEVSIGNDRYCDSYLYQSDIEILAKNDGFESIEEFKDWFIPLIEKSNNGYFTGKIIHWTASKY